MEITFDKEYLRKLYEHGKCSDKKHRYQPQVIKKYTKVIDLMFASPNTMSLAKYNSLHYEKIVGNKTGLSSVRVNDQYRIEFKEEIREGEMLATICNIIELSNHYQ
ncbi:MAG: type II toxin-antitoxin system RelE/ParE family toxin [Bacteroidales bacterium]|nr:type II toxin-antitoxin system RelE/ParE family toxin [Bacteroidales bacterium]